MTIKVIIERSMNPDNAEKGVGLLMDLRAKAMRQSGYISGETLFSVDRLGTHVVISTWESLHDWKTWESNPERTEILREIETLLSSPSKTSIFETARQMAFD
jgi:heme-degrading monooxygenase HmoA